MNNWIYTALRKPTKADGNENGLVFVRWEDGGVGRQHVDFVGRDKYLVAAWMPIPKYQPLPPVPEGYKLLTDYDAEPDKRALWYNYHDNKWKRPTAIIYTYLEGLIYCVPITPPWVPAIVTAGVLKPGAWVCIDMDGSWYYHDDKPEFTIGRCWSTSRHLPVAEQPQIVGEKAIWQIQ